MRRVGQVITWVAIGIAAIIAFALLSPLVLGIALVEAFTVKGADT